MEIIGLGLPLRSSSCNICAAIFWCLDTIFDCRSINSWWIWAAGDLFYQKTAKFFIETTKNVSKHLSGNSNWIKRSNLWPLIWTRRLGTFTDKAKHFEIAFYVFRVINLNIYYITTVTTLYTKMFSVDPSIDKKCETWNRQIKVSYPRLVEARNTPAFDGEADRQYRRRIATMTGIQKRNTVYIVCDRHRELWPFHTLSESGAM